jgi:phosphonate transport system substrate-binding protein
MRYFFRVFSLFLSLCLTLWSVPSSAEESRNGLTLGVHPYLTAQVLIARFEPMAKHLSDKLGVPVTVLVAKDYQTHIDDIGQDKLDIAYMGPASYVEMVEKYGGKPLLARQEVNGTPLLRGAIITSAHSNINSLQDIAGKRFAFGSSQSTMGHFVPRYMLWEADVSDDKLAKFDFMSNHDDVVLAVLMDDYDVGAVKEEMLTKYAPHGLKLVSWTIGISEHLFVTRADLPIKQVDTIRQALFALKQQADGMSIITAIQTTLTGFVPVEDEDYANLRAILTALKAKGIE